ncbi:MAG: isoprenyl transferase [Clostridiales bacterium]|jgi:undecaprenyl diphosphate synthase|nr:isoprenyl transferase [Clostridiales bacterium]
MKSTAQNNSSQEGQRVLPRHLGIIMDGNGRWAKKRGLPRSMGHRAGAANFKKIIRYCNSIGIECLTMYAFSTENWKRPKEEVGALMVLFKQYLKDALKEFLKENVQVRFIGDSSVFDEGLQTLIRKNEELGRTKNGMILNIAMNYGGRAEIVQAARSLAKQVQAGTRKPEEITEEALSQQLYTAGQPDLDLVIRPSGEYRISNFMLWQSAYAEYIVMDILWPDFTPENLEWALDEYANRNRRFGGV